MQFGGQDWDRARKDLQQFGRYHSLTLPGGERLDGLISEATLQRRIEKLGVPLSLSGKRALDIGCWDGWFSFELERRGATVTAIDLVEQPSMRKAISEMNSRVDYRARTVYDLDPRDGQFEIVLCLGVLYHLKHPLLALEKVCAVTLDTAYIETFVTDGIDGIDDRPRADFYEAEELAGQFDNWCGPNVACVLAMLRAAGFATAEYLGNLGERAHFVARRRVAAAGAPAPCAIHGLQNALDQSLEFWYKDDPYVSLYVLAGSMDGLAIRVGEFDATPAVVRGANIVAKIPPGLPPGLHPLRLLSHGVPAGPPFQIAIDTAIVPVSDVSEAGSGRFRRVEITDGVSGGTVICNLALSVWFATESRITRDAVAVRLNGADLAIDYVGQSQINAVLPRRLEPGRYQIELLYDGEVGWAGPITIGHSPFAIARP